MHLVGGGRGNLACAPSTDWATVARHQPQHEALCRFYSKQAEPHGLKRPCAKGRLGLSVSVDKKTRAAVGMELRSGRRIHSASSNALAHADAHRAQCVKCPKAAAAASWVVAIARRATPWTALLVLLAIATYLDVGSAWSASSAPLSWLHKQGEQPATGVSAVPLNYLLKFPNVLGQPASGASASLEDGLWGWEKSVLKLQSFF